MKSSKFMDNYFILANGKLFCSAVRCQQAIHEAMSQFCTYCRRKSWEKVVKPQKSLNSSVILKFCQRNNPMTQVREHE